MSDDRTTDQRTADDAMTEAVANLIAAYRDEGNEGLLLTDYVVIAAQRGFAEDGHGVTATAVMPRDGDIPEYALLGLLEYGATIVRAGIVED